MANTDAKLVAQVAGDDAIELAQVANTGGRAKTRSAGVKYETLQIGLVIRSGAGTYDALVRIGTQLPFPCIQSASLNNSLTGAGMTDSKLIQEGSLVLVHKPKITTAMGIILCVVPPALMEEQPKERIQAHQIDAEPGVAYYTELSYRQPIEDSEDVNVMDSNASRAIDVFPGDDVGLNELGVGVSKLKLLLQMRATARCKLELFYLDDLYRMVSGQFQHFSAIGEEHIYNDFGYVTHERFGSMHQCEVQGLAEYDTPPVTRTDAADDATQCNWKAKAPAMTPHKRFHDFTGHLGGLYQMFAIEPSEEAYNTYGAGGSKGLLHVSIDDGGRFMLRSVSDICFQRTDMISVPIKNKEPWDPSGDDISKDDPTKPKEPFVYTEPTKMLSHPLQQRDYFAWARKLTYQRFYENSDLNGKDDWILKEESDAPKPSDRYDVIIKNEEDYSKWEDRTVTFALRKDGGMTMRNSEGAEISLSGSDIEITCPGSIRMRAGDDVIALAGDDFIAKAKHSVDISASEHDVRIKAERNLHQYSGNSVLIQSGEEEDSPSTKGESIDTPPGVIIRSTKNRIVLWADTVQLTAIKDVIISGAKDAAARIVMAAKNIIGIADDINLGANNDGGDPAGLRLQSGIAQVFGTTALLVGDKAASVIRGSEQGVFMFWSDTESEYYAPLSEKVTDAAGRYLDSDASLGEFTESAMKDHVFTYRTESDYGTDKNFEMYESHWSFMGRQGSNVPTAPWDEPEIHATRPWPGHKAYESASVFYQMDKEENITDATGKPVSFDKRKAKGGKFTKKKFNEYKG